MDKLSKLQALSLWLPFLVHFALELQLSNGLQSEPRQLYIVYLGERQHEDADLVTASHHDMLSSILGSKEEALQSIVYSYKHGFSGFSARLTESQARKIQALPGVVSVRKNQIWRTHTTRSWDFLGMGYSHQPNGLLAKNGDGIIIGVIDTGIWPESQSFADDGSYGPPPSKWKGTCQTGASFGPHNCNRKLIGARWYTEGIDKSFFKGEFMSARDANGHGTHTASTAGGNIVHNISFHGLAAGTASGGAPRARIAIYKAGWGASEPTSSDAIILKAIDDAIHDGVDVLSLSLGAPTEYPGTLHAVANGITVVFSAGNDGPTVQTVLNSSPWLLTVAATTVDRQFPTAITLGNNQKLVGQSLFAGMEGRANDVDQFHKLVALGLDDDFPCDASFVNSTGAAMDGVVVFCRTLNPSLNEIASVLAKKGGKGIIFSEGNTDLLISSLETACRGSLPCVAVDFEIYNQILQYYKQYSDSPKVKISFARTTIGTGVPAPKIATFSSRGPSIIYPGVLKPDVAAPGVSILAAAPQIPVYKSLGAFYHFMSGTSMSCPHVSGIVAVLKSLHPDWSPAALKSALMTTALTTDNNGIPIQADGYRAKVADPFDYGAGFVNPIKAADPGLIYDISASDYLNFFNCMGGLGSNGSCTTPKSSLPDLNLPSIAIPNLKMSETVVRTVTNVGQPNAVYKAFFQPPAGVEMSVEPPVLVFCKESRVQSFKVTFKATRKIQGDYTFGSLAWHDGGDHWVRIPIAVRIIIEEFYSYVS